MTIKRKTSEATRILICGGTFDKEYDELTGKLYFRGSHVEEMLKLGRSRIKISIEKVFMIDSLEMTNKHRLTLLNKCRKVKEKQIVITHGTDTMEKTALMLSEANLDKTIVLTGAMVPYKFGSSDGMFNLGAALAFVQSLPVGVYVTMNGQVFSGDNVKKNRQTGEFGRRKN